MPGSRPPAQSRRCRPTAVACVVRGAADKGQSSARGGSTCCSPGARAAAPATRRGTPPGDASTHAQIRLLLFAGCRPEVCQRLQGRSLARVRLQNVLREGDLSTLRRRASHAPPPRALHPTPVEASSAWRLRAERRWRRGPGLPGRSPREPRAGLGRKQVRLGGAGLRGERGRSAGGLHLGMRRSGGRFAGKAALSAVRAALEESDR